MDGRFDELISRDLDGDLDEAERAALETAAETDGEVAGRREGLRRVQEAVRELADRDEPPRDLDLVLEPLVRSRRPGGWTGRRWIAAAAAAAATILIGAVGWWPTTHAPVGVPASDDGATPHPERPTAAAGAGHDGRSELHAAIRRGRLPEFPAADEPRPLDVIGPLPFPPEVFGGRLGAITLADERSIPVRVPAECPPGDHSVVAEEVTDGVDDLRVLTEGDRSLAACTPVVALAPVPAGIGRVRARLVVEG